MISENKEFLHDYDFPPLLAEPDLQWWPRNKHVYCAETIKLESHCFFLPSFIVIFLDSFDFDQMRPVKVLQSDCSWLFFSKLSVLLIFILILFSWKLKNDRSLPLTSALVYLTPMLFIHAADVKKNTQRFEVEVRMSWKSVWWNNLTEGSQLHQQNTWDSEHIFGPLTLCSLNAFQEFESCRHVTSPPFSKTHHRGFNVVTEQLHRQGVILMKCYYSLV